MLAGKTLTKVANQSTKDKAYSLKLIDQESNLRVALATTATTVMMVMTKIIWMAMAMMMIMMMKWMILVLLFILKTHDALCLR